MKNIIIVANIVAKDEFALEMYDLLVQLHAQTHAHDTGCIQYDMHRDINNSNSYTFIETWEDEEALEAHIQMHIL